MMPDAPHVRPETVQEQVDALARDAWDFQMEESPLSATYVGDGRGDDRVDEYGPEARERRKARLTDLRERLAALPPTPHGSETDLTRRILERSIDLDLEAFEHHAWEWDVDQIFGLHLTLQNVMSLQPLGDEEACEKLLTRLAEVPRALKQHIGDLRDGIASGRVPPRLAVQRVIAQLRTFRDTPVEETVFVAVGTKRAPAACPGVRGASGSSGARPAP
jgi:uncharacterized protein (DUF885 family)